LISPKSLKKQVSLSACQDVDISMIQTVTTSDWFKSSVRFGVTKLQVNVHGILA